jgi:hypothetical protein
MGRWGTVCKLCGVRLIAKIEPKHKEVYTLSRVKEMP